MPSHQQYVDAAAELLGTPVLACGPCTRTKGLSALALGQVSGVAGLIQRHRGATAAAGLPDAFLLAVTADAVVALSQPKVRWNPRPKASGELLRLPRAEVAVATSPAAFGTKIVLESPDLERPLEIQTAGRTDELVDALAAAPIAG